MSTVQRDPFILDRPTGRRLRARDALVCVFVAALLLLLLEGESIRSTGEKMDPGIERTAVLAVGEPAGWIADRLPLGDAADNVTAHLSPDDDLTGDGGFNAGQTVPPLSAAAAGGAGGGASVPITTDSFDPTELGVQPARLPALRTLLVTGDSLAQPLDVQLARRLAGDGVQTIRDAHLGTGISKTDIVDWGLLSTQQVQERKPEAVVMFMGANEGFPFPGAGAKKIECCGPEWAVVYATRARRMMDTYRRKGTARVYWLTLPLPRDSRRQEIARAVNAAIDVAAQPFRSQVRVLDMTSVFTPGGRYRAAQDVGGRETIVRRPDGIHLNDAGAGIASRIVLGRLRADFQKLGG
jgi:lysophospholipase L1-like esterase